MISDPNEHLFAQVAPVSALSSRPRITLPAGILALAMCATVVFAGCGGDTPDDSSSSHHGDGGAGDGSAGDGGGGGGTVECPELSGQTLLIPWKGTGPEEGVSTAGHFAMTSTHFYWAAGGSAYRAEKKIGAEPEFLTKGASGVALGGTSFYWCDSFGLYRAPLEGGDHETVASTPAAFGLADHCAVTADDTNVYWAVIGSVGGEEEKNLEITRRPHAGGAPTTLLKKSGMTNLSGVALAADASGLYSAYFSAEDSFRILQFPANGKQIQVYPPPNAMADSYIPYEIDAMRTDGTSIYLATPDYVYWFDKNLPGALHHLNKNTTDVLKVGDDWYGLQVPHDDEIGIVPPAQIVRYIPAADPEVIVTDMKSVSAWGLAADSCNFYWATDQGIRAQPRSPSSL